MSTSKYQSILESNELPVNLDELPNFKIKVPSQDIFASYYSASSDSEVQMQVAVLFINELDKLIKEKNTDGLLVLYDVQFNKICSSVFKESAWPAPHEIELYQDKEIDIDIAYLYSELCYRHALARLQNSFDAELVCNSWENYNDIFDTVIHAQTEFPLPVPWIWDIIDEYIYQFYFACRWRYTIKPEDQGLKEILAKDSRDLTFWNLENINENFTSVIQKSQIFEKGVLTLKEATSTSHYFGFFTLVGQLRLNVLIGNYDAAIKSIENLDFDSLVIFSKAFPAYFNLFYYAGFAYLMTGRYKEAVKVLESVCLMMNKYKAFLTKSSQSENMMKQLEKAVCLFAISLVFYPNKASESTFWQFKDLGIKTSKQNSQNRNEKERIVDKFDKLQRYDIQTFNELFNYGCPKLIEPIQSLDSFKDITNKNTSDLIINAKEKLTKEFKVVQNLNNLATVMKLYSKINLQKAASIVNVSKDEFLNLLKQYEKRETSDLLKTPFEQTVLSRFFLPTPILKFDINGDNITINEVVPVKNYTEQYQKLNKKMTEIYSDVLSLL
ncbi:RNA polymerase I-associated factor PAF67 (macronuclear) [Tetrahymena thermophila SB210]|uniref:Eukaryotic translation initiation factor 3 subunit L n=1 Tax=Tetrahymena thermophila (strain SB210) TaxID=312017 RepID=Q23T76_TETTS|nr:RNA polymerase I-associated factor PAF67 [Tetrahymena thermophila SB210]EAR99830.2 RNA polymerase I-associated factor PAF67 [Tetrahymena thermophila SB210]|eukprot:XP_001020075.2 RNA polymerase I-associated factor PAF67 [Tetrahymena thermophila SB210]